MTPAKRQLMNRQRDARLAMEASRPSKPRDTRINLPRTGDIQTFWSLVDRSAGEFACHPWLGHSVRSGSRGHKYQQNGSFQLDIDAGRETIARRLVVRLLLDVNVPDDVNIIPICRNGLCCNLSHLAASPLRGHLGHAIPVNEFFCGVAA